MVSEWVLEESNHKKVVWSTNNPKLLQHLAAFEKLKRIVGWGAAKGYKPRSATQVRSLLILAPPAWWTWTRAADGTESSELFANMMILNRHCRLTLTEAHPKRGRKVKDFEGYSERAEEHLLKFAAKQLKGMVSVRGRHLFDSGLLRAA